MSGATTLLANVVLGDNCTLGEKELEHLKKAQKGAEALMDVARSICAALIP